MTYPLNSTNPHRLRRLLSTLQLRLTNGVQLQLLALRHRSLQPDPSDAFEVAGVAETSEDLGGVAGTLDLKGEVDRIFLVCGVGLRR